MIGLENKDSSFFNVDSDNWPAFSSLGKILNENVASFEVTEEMGKMMNGSLTFYDDDLCTIAALLKLGSKLTISWGYKMWDVSLAAISEMNPSDYFAPAPVKRGMAALVTAPSGSGGNDGVIKYNCNFIQSPFVKEKNQYRKYVSMAGVVIKKYDVVFLTLQEMGILPINAFIDFTRMSEPVWSPIIRDFETPYKFLVRLSFEWGAIFRIAYDATGLQMIAVFISPNKQSLFFQKMTGAIGLYNEFRFKTARTPNVKSYNWKYNVGENGSGDNVQIVYVNGQAQFWRSQATTEGVVWYKLNTEKMQSEMAKRNPKAQLELYQQWMGANNFEDVKDKYFIRVNDTTAPQGIGLSINMECIGNPLMTAPNSAEFVGAFPDYFKTTKGIKFFIRKVTHKIDHTGYNMSVEVVDAFTLSGGSLVG